MSYQKNEAPNLELLVDRLRTNIASEETKKALKENVKNTIKNIRILSSVPEEVKIVGGIYNVKSGKVKFYKYSKKKDGLKRICNAD